MERIRQNSCIRPRVNRTAAIAALVSLIMAHIPLCPLISHAADRAPPASGPSAEAAPSDACCGGGEAGAVLRSETPPHPGCCSDRCSCSRPCCSRTPLACEGAAIVWPSGLAAYLLPRPPARPDDAPPDPLLHPPRL